MLGSLRDGEAEATTIASKKRPMAAILLQGGTPGEEPCRNAPCRIAFVKLIRNRSTTTLQTRKQQRQIAPFLLCPQYDLIPTQAGILLHKHSKKYEVTARTNDANLRLAASVMGGFRAR